MRSHKLGNKINLAALALSLVCGPTSLAFGGWLQDAGGAISDAGKGVAGGVASVTKDVAGNITTVGKNAAGDLTTEVKRVGGDIVTTTQYARGAVVTQWKNADGAITTSYKDVAGNLATEWKDASNNTTTVWKDISGNITTEWKHGADIIKTEWRDASGKVTEESKNAAGHLVTVLHDSAGRASTVIRDPSGQVLTFAKDMFGYNVISNLDSAGANMWTYLVDEAGNILSTSQLPYNQWFAAVANHSVPGVQVTVAGLVADAHHVGSQISYGIVGLGKLVVAIGSKVTEVLVRSGEGIFDAIQREYYHVGDLTTDEWKQFQRVFVNLTDVQAQVSTLKNTLNGLKSELGTLPNVHTPAYLERFSQRLQVSIPPGLRIPTDVSLISGAPLKLPLPKDLFGDVSASLGSGSVFDLPKTIPLDLPSQTAAINLKMAEMEHSFEKWTNQESAKLVRTIAHLYIPAIKSSIYKSYRVFLADKDAVSKAVFKRGESPRAADDPEYVKRLRTWRTCLDRAKGVVSAYKDHVSSLGLVTAAENPNIVTLSFIANASEVLAADAVNLAKMAVEIKANACDKVGLDIPLRKTLDDATKWQTWLLDTRTSLNNQDR